MKEGRTAAGKLLIDLQVRKSTADGAGARKFYTELTTPLPGWDGEIRDIVLKKKLVCHPCFSTMTSTSIFTHLFLASQDLRST